MGPSELAEAHSAGIRYDPEKGKIFLTKDGLRTAHEIEWERCRKDPQWFLLDSGLVKTLDRKPKYPCLKCKRVLSPDKKRRITDCPDCGSPVTRRDPIQPFPRAGDWNEKLYLYDVLHFLQSEPLYAIPKSRELMLTEIVCGWIFTCLMFEPSTEAVVQSEEERKAAACPERVHGYWTRLPEWMKRRRPCNPTKGGESIHGYFEIPNNNAVMFAFAQGDTQIREKHPTIYFGDEMSYWAKAKETWGAVEPVADAGCQVILVSTAADGGGGPTFRGICTDTLKDVA